MKPFMFLSPRRKLLEIGFALFDSYVVVNSFIAWRNHILSGRPEKERCHKKYGIREARLKLIPRWAKRCSRHYKRTEPHRQKRLRLVIINIYQIVIVVTVQWLCVSWKLLLWKWAHSITTSLSKCQQALVAVSYARKKRNTAAGDAHQSSVWSLSALRISAPTAILSFTTCEMKYEKLWDITVCEMSYKN